MADQDSSPVAGTGMALGDVVYGRRASGHEVQFNYTEMAAMANASYNPPRGTFTANGATPVSVANANVTSTTIVAISLASVNSGTVGAFPTIQTYTPGTGFTVKATAGDTGIYNYVII